MFFSLFSGYIALKGCDVVKGQESDADGFPFDLISSGVTTRLVADSTVSRSLWISRIYECAKKWVAEKIQSSHTIALLFTALPGGMVIWLCLTLCFQNILVPQASECIVYCWLLSIVWAPVLIVGKTIGYLLCERIIQWFFVIVVNTRNELQQKSGTKSRTRTVSKISPLRSTNEASCMKIFTYQLVLVLQGSSISTTRTFLTTSTASFSLEITPYENNYQVLHLQRVFFSRK